MFDKMRDRFRRTELKAPERSRELEEHDLRLWQLFLRTGLLQLDWYRQQNSDVEGAGVDIAEHFRQYGWREGRWPNQFFDPTWYLAKNPDVAQADLNPVIHYWLYGEKENRKPHPLFEPTWYRKVYGEQVGNSNLLAHYLRSRHLKLFSPNHWFDIEFYLKTQRDVAAAEVEPFDHFITTGFKEGRNPHPQFHVQYYLQHHMVGDPRDPLTHFFEIGFAAGHPTTPSEMADSQAAEIRKYSRPAPEFEEFNPNIGRGLPRRAKVLAYYLPQFHTFPENDKWWGKGFTEWTNVGRGTPRFVGHYQPRIPRDLGFYSLRDPSVLPMQVEAAKAAGLFGFCFYYYNFNGKRLLDFPVEDFLARTELDFPFCLMWANENWTRRWDGAESEVLMKQDYREADAEDLIDDLARHFIDARYIHIGKRPLLFVYRSDIIPNARETLQRWRRLFEERHNMQPLIFMAQSFGNHDPAHMGFDGAIEFPPHKVTVNASVANSECHVFDSNFAARVYRYEDVVRSAMSELPPPYPLIKTVFPSWDNDARRQGQGMSVTGSTPALYSEWLDYAIRFATQNPIQGERFVCINAWNEWAEGAYLEPDLHFGSAYLNATARVATGTGVQGQRLRVVLVGHNAFPAGAQTLLLQIAKTLRGQFGVDVSVLLCGGGKMLDAYSAICPTIAVSEKLSLEEASKQILQGGFEGVIANSVGSGSAIAYLKHGGLRVVALVHEMPRLMAENNLVAYAKELAKSADEVIFPSPIVRDKFVEFIGDVSGALSIRPQGIYSRLERVPDAKKLIVDELGLPPNAKIILNVGYADPRKGVDIFCSIAKLAGRFEPDAYFIWAGDIHLHFKTWIDDPRANPNVRFLGQRSDISTLMSAADVFALTSREDPFPSVVLEAQSLGVPVVCFDQSGGAADLIASNEFGTTVPYGDIDQFSSAILDWLSRDPNTKEDFGQRVSEEIRSSYAFDLYAAELLQRISPALRTISVIVPNYNYARYVEGRLRSIFDQTYPVLEIIFLDDCSTDGSIEVASKFSHDAARVIRIVPGEANSGSPFSQWQKGLSLARGDLVWIAEADDLSDPLFLARLASFFLRNDTLFAFCDSTPIGAEGERLDISYKAYYAKVADGALADEFVMHGSAFARHYLSERNLMLNVSSILWRKNALIDAMQSCETTLPTYRLAGDWLIYLAACGLEGTVAYDSTELNQHRRHDGGVTRQTNGERQVGEVEKIHAQFRQQFGSDDEIERKQDAYISELRDQFGLRQREPTG